MPVISVIVPVYKVEEFLPRCVESLRNQTFQDFSLILVDDGSPDNCGAICDSYARKDQRIHVIHQKNGGLSAARNAGLDWMYAHEDTQWVAFVDSDDWVHPSYLEKLYTAAVSTDCRISTCGFFKTSGGAFPVAEEEAPRKMTADAFYCSKHIHGGITAVAWNKLYHRSLLEQLRYPVGKLHEDEFITFRAVYAAGSIGVLESPLYAYYQNPEGIMLSKWNPRRLHILEATQQQIIFAQETGNKTLLRKAALQYILSCHDHLKKADPQYRKELRKNLRYGLKIGRECDVFPAVFGNLWAYEEAYPMKLLWWAFFKGHALMTRLTGKDNNNG